MSWQLGAFSVLAFALAAGFAWYERVRPDARIVALVATLAAFAALGRIAFAAVPNVKPTTDIVLIAGYALGGAPGFAVGALAGLSSNFFFGQGPWTPWQMAGWGVTGMIGAGLAWLVAARVWMRDGRLRDGRRTGWPRDRRPVPPLGRWPLAIVCCGVGFAFTALQDVGDWVTYSDHSSLALGLYVGRGLGFDAIHAAGCLVFALVLGPALTRSIQRFARRLQVTWVLDPAPPPAPGAEGRSRGSSVGGIAAVLIAVGLVLAALGTRAAGAEPAASPAHVRSAAAAYLMHAENADGGFGAAPGQPSAQLYAGWAALGLASAGDDLDRVARGGSGVIGYIARGVPSDAGSIERTILVVRAAGASARSFGGHDLIAQLQRHVGANGSVAGQVNLTAFAVLALRAAGVGGRGADLRTLRWLAAQQDRDGGFSFAGAGGSSDIDDTGAALEALAGDASAGAVKERAVAFLRAHQDRDGGFPSQPGTSSNAQSTAWAIQGLDAFGVSAARLHRNGSPSPIAYLDSLASSDGQIGYARGVRQTPVWVTGEALMALEGKPLPLAAVTAAARTSRPASAAASRPGGGGGGRRHAGPTSKGTGSRSGSSASGVAAQGPGSPRAHSAGAPASAPPAGSVRGARSSRSGAGRVASAASGGLSIAELLGAAGMIAALVLAAVGVG